MLALATKRLEQTREMVTIIVLWVVLTNIPFFSLFLLLSFFLTRYEFWLLCYILWSSSSVYWILFWTGLLWFFPLFMSSNDCELLKIFKHYLWLNHLPSDSILKFFFFSSGLFFIQKNSFNQFMTSVDVYSYSTKLSSVCEHYSSTFLFNVVPCLLIWFNSRELGLPFLPL